MEGQAHPTYFEQYLDHAVVSRPHYAPHHPHLTALKRELQSWFFYYFEPRERMRAPTSVKEVRHVGLMGEELAAFLYTLRNLDRRTGRAQLDPLYQRNSYRSKQSRRGRIELDGG